MEIRADNSVQSIDSSTLTPIVRQALQRETLQVLDWQVKQLGGGVGNPVTAGIYRFAGSAQDGDVQVPWSAILKVLQSPANVGYTNFGEKDDQTHWNYWKRELFVYQSGLLDTLPRGMTAPRCFGVFELPGDVAWLWLEDIIDSYGGVWSLERYALTAHHLGQFNGRYLSECPLPDFSWLSKNIIQQWVSLSEWQSLSWDHPRVLEHYPRSAVNPFRRMLLENERFRAELARLPKTVCHGDTYPTNFMSRFIPGTQEQTVALDWALVGIGALGEDLGQLVLGAQMNLKEIRQEEIDKSLFESYLDGLRESGCRIDPQWVRFGYAASAALRVGLFQVLLLSMELEQIEPVVEETVEQHRVPDCFEVTMANQAYELLDAIG
jgi:hypothetical protein